MKKIGWIVSLFTGGLSALASGIAVYSYTNSPVATLDDVVVKIEQLSTVVSTLSVNQDDADKLNAAIAELSSDAVNLQAKSIPNATTYVRVFGGAFRLPKNSSIDLELPSGGFASLGLKTIIPTHSTAYLVFNGEEYRLTAGELIPIPEEGCNLLYIGPETAELDDALVRFRCR